MRYGTVDVDSFPLEVHGDQEGADYNGHYQSIIYHPLVASFSVAGDYDGVRQSGRLDIPRFKSPHGRRAQGRPH